MKYNKFSLKQNLIFLLVLLIVSVNLFACSDVGNDENSADKPALSLETAIELVERDKKITEMFVCNSLWNGNNDSLSYVLPEDNEFASFSSVEELLNSTYTNEGRDKELFLSYPEYGEKSLSNSEGKTKVFYHAGSEYTDFIDTASVSVGDTETENVKAINAKTVSGKDVTLKAFYTDGKWLLENGIYKTNGGKTEITPDPAYSELGSLRSFTGSVLVIELFVSDSESAFTDGQEEAFHKKIASAVDFLAEQSEKYGAKIKVTYEPAYFHHAGIVGTRPIDFDLDFAETDFGSLENFAKANFKVDEYDNYFFVVCLDKEVKTSCCRYEDTETTELYFGERVSIGKNSTPEEICLSTLNVLGTVDYSDEIFEPYVADLFKSYFPNDITVKKDLSSSEMSPVTAYICGMTRKLDSLFNVFINK